MEEKRILKETVVKDKVLFKLPEKKEPVIAICFEKRAEAENTNADLVLKHAKDSYSLNIWLTPAFGRTLNLMLVSDYNQRLYRNLAFDSSQFDWWLQFTKGNPNTLAFKFYHLYQEGDKMKLAKTPYTNSPFMLNLKRFNLKDK